jgi:putative transcriptional regulator
MPKSRSKPKSSPPKYNRIGEVLEEQGKTQAWLAGELELEFRTVNRYVNNHRQPSIERLFEIARVLRAKPGDLLT